MTVAPGEIKLENKLDVIQHAPQEKPSRSAHSMNDVNTFYTFNTRFESSASITQTGQFILYYVKSKYLVTVYDINVLTA